MTVTSLPPGPSAPMLAQTARWIARPAAMMADCRRRYGDAFTLTLLNEGNWVFLSDPEAVKQVFTGDPRILHAGKGNQVLLPILGSQSVLLLDEHQHMSHRKLLLPPFHGERMRAYADTMSEVTAREIERWPAGEPLALQPRMQDITLEVILRTVFGVQDESERDRMRHALTAALDWAATPGRLALAAALGPHRMSRLRPFQRVLAPADELIYAEIRRRRGASDLEERDDVLSMLLAARYEDGSPIADKELRDELMTLLVAGHETTAMSLAWAVERLVRHPHVLQRLCDEVDAGDDAYVDAVAKETLRLRPILSVVVRRLQEPMEIGGHLLPADTVVAPCSYLVHRRPDIYPEPLAFRPERFLEQPAGTYTWFPFGGGVRRCLGASFALFEMKVVLAELVSRLDLRAARPRSERAVRRAIALAPERGAEVVVRPRRAPARALAPAA